jgi:alpha-beta hydrolase superfamily lysophospholipase
MYKTLTPTQEFSFKGRDHVQIAAYSWLPTTNQKSWKGVIQISHGMAEHALRYGRFAKALNDAGYVVYAHDHRGHGKTIAQTDDQGFFAEKDGWNLVVDDTFILNQKIKTNHPTLPIILFAHSMGTFISQQYVAKHGETLAGLILSASIDNAGFLRNIGLIIAKIERLRIGARGQSNLLNTMSFGDFNKPFKPNRTEFDWLSRDDSAVDKYINDPLCGFIVTTQLWIDLLQGLGTMALPSTRKSVPSTLPILLITGEDDPVTQKGKTVDELKLAYEKAGIKNVSAKKYTGGRHESLNETNRDEVTTDIIAWLAGI